MKLTIFALALASATMLSGSGFVSLNPFVTDEDAVMDPALLGTWADSDDAEIHISQDGTGYRIRITDPDPSWTYEFKARLMVAGDVKLLDLVSAEEDPLQLAVHVPVRIWIEGNNLRFTNLGSGWLEELARQQLSTVPSKSGTLIISPGEAVKNFLTIMGADPACCDEPEVLHRPE